MLIFYDDIVYSLQKAGGISVMWAHITEQNVYKSIHIVHHSAENNEFFKENVGQEYNFIDDKMMTVRRYINPVLKKTQQEPFIFHSSYYRYCGNKYAINITTVYDFIYEFYRHDIKAMAHKLQKKNAVMHSDGVICISESTKKDLQKLYPAYKGMIKVIHCGYDTETYYYEAHSKEKIILSVGARVSYKRFDITVKIVKALIDCKLIIVGGGKLTEDEIALLESEIPGRYEKSGYLSNDELRQLYNKAFFLSYCSDYEGFGIPPIEAQACGCPVVCQEKSSIPEVVQDSGVYIDPNNMEESIDRIKLLYDEKYYSQIVQKGLENVKRFSWDKCRDEVTDFYKDVLKSKKIDCS
jgi:mannosyltransferase